MSKRPPPLKKKSVLLVIAAVGILLAGLAIAQTQSTTISLNSPVSFPVDI